MPSNPRTDSSRSPRNLNDRQASLRSIAESTLQAISDGRYVHEGTKYTLSSRVAEAENRVVYFGPDSLSGWSSSGASKSQSHREPSAQTKLSIQEISSLQGATMLSTAYRNLDHPGPRIGVLNFASAKKPGGGFLTGQQAQEESIARSSTLYPTLMTSTAQQLYSLHKRNPEDGFYTHAMIFSPSITVFRDDSGEWTPPLEIDVVTSPAVNAGVVRSRPRTRNDTEDRIDRAMKERMARILYLFETEKIRHLVLGSFGTGVFKNNVAMVAETWADLLAVEGARFETSFDKVVFAVIGTQTYNDFKAAFESRIGRPKIHCS